MSNRILIILLTLGLRTFGQILGVDMLVNSGPVINRVNIVFMSDGYTSSEMPKFINDVTTASNHMLSVAPFSNYKNYINVYAVKVVSPESGVTHQGIATDVVEPASPTMAVNNNFNTRFDNFNIHRLISSMNSAAVYSAIGAAFPNYDQLIILGNSSEYGGSGGPFAVSSAHASAPDIVLHEMGHSFAGLADEYWAGINYAGEYANMTSGLNILSLKWAPWLGIDSVSYYYYGTTNPAHLWVKPKRRCKMNTLDAPFCPICSQTIIEKIHSLTNPIDGYFPDDPAMIYDVDANWFKAYFVKPEPNTIRTRWELNATPIASNKDSVLIYGNMLNPGVNYLVLQAMDTTALSKDSVHVLLHSYSVMWRIAPSEVGIKKVMSVLELSLFPNPVNDVLNIKYNLKEESELEISLLDLNGRVVKREEKINVKPGKYEKKMDVSLLSPGSYLVSLKLNENTINQNIIITK